MYKRKAFVFEWLIKHQSEKRMYLENCIYETSKNTLNVDTAREELPKAGLMTGVKS